jgi:hypothetical protein
MVSNQRAVLFTCCSCGGETFTLFEQLEDSDLGGMTVTHNGLLADDCGRSAEFRTGDAASVVFCDALRGWLVTTEVPTTLPSVSRPEPFPAATASVLDSLMSIGKELMREDEKMDGGAVVSRLLLISNAPSLRITASVTLPSALRVPDLLAVSVSKQCVSTNIFKLFCVTLRD